MFQNNWIQEFQKRSKEKPLREIENNMDGLSATNDFALVATLGLRSACICSFLSKKKEREKERKRRDCITATVMMGRVY